MMDFDPRDYDDSREREEHSRDQDRDHNWKEPGTRSDLDVSHDRWADEQAHGVGVRDRDRDERDRDEDDGGPHIGRGPSSHDEKPESDPRDRDDERWPDRDHDPRDVFLRDLDLPRGREREIVRDRDRQYTLRGSESR